MYAGEHRKIIIGIHTTGDKGTGVSILAVSQKDILQALDHFTPQISSGIIQLDAPGFARELGPLHPKSSLRFIQNGTAQIMGSFKGYRPQHKSHVKETFIKDIVIKDGYAATHGPPDMTWKPWHLGLTDMTKPNYSVQSQDVD